MLYLKMNDVCMSGHCLCLKLFLEGRGQVFGNTKSFHGNVNCGNSSGISSIGAAGSNSFLHGDVIRVLREEVRHCSRIFCLQYGDVGLVFFVGHGMSEDFLSFGIGDGCPGDISSASVGLNTDALSTLGGDGELDLVEVGEVISRRSLQCLARGEFLVGFALFDGLNGNVEETDQKGQFVDSHVLQHTLSVTLEALAQRFGIVFVCVV
mmetsp:Transcript_22841/g.63450  ORF Transcript_22841/g.63450 Transcript_22841/m.63450 type:complete len:208 (+) Transcript_22841:395-1018(+)